MPNRILREGILTSERVGQLGWPAEIFYRRLMSVVDDFGRYYAKPELLRAACYPLLPDKVGNSDIGKWIAVCREAALVRTYTVDGKEYIELLDFRQQVRAKESKFPSPLSTCAADAQQQIANAHLDVDVVEDVSEDDKKPRQRPAAKAAFELPDWVPKPQWDAWIDARKKKRNAPTEFAMRMAVSKLEELKAEGHHPAAVLAKAAFNGWTDLYPLKQS